MLALRSWRIGGTGTGIFSVTGFFLRRKNTDDFFVTVGGTDFALDTLEPAASFWSCLGRRDTGFAKFSRSRISDLCPSSEPGGSCCDASGSSRTAPEGVTFLLEPNMRRKNPGLSLVVYVGLDSMKGEFNPGELMCVGNGGKASRLF